VGGGLGPLRLFETGQNGQRGPVGFSGSEWGEWGSKLATPTGTSADIAAFVDHLGSEFPTHRTLTRKVYAKSSELAGPKLGVRSFLAILFLLQTNQSTDRGIMNPPDLGNFLQGITPINVRHPRGLGAGTTIERFGQQSLKGRSIGKSL